MNEHVDVKPHIVIPYYIYHSSLGCVGQKYCGLIFGLSSKYGFCTAKNEYFARFFYVGEWDQLSEVEKDRKIDAAKKQINLITKQKFIKNIGSSHHRKLMLNYIENVVEEELTETGKKFPFETETGKKFPQKGKKFPLLPIIYIKYILKSKSKREQGQKTDAEMLNELFNLFWSVYPRREKKKSCQVLFDKLHPTNMEKLLFILPQITTRYQETQKNYIPLPTTFLNGELWNDDYFTSEKSKNNEKSQKEGAAVVATPEMEACVQRFRALSDGDNVELETSDNEVLGQLGFSVEDAIEEIQLFSLNALRERIATVWDDARSVS